MTSNAVDSTVATADSADFSLDASEQGAMRAQRRRPGLVNGVRVAVFVAFVAVWEWAAGRAWIDPFFFGQPSGVARQIWDWLRDGTPQGSLWIQIAATLEEAALGLVLGCIAGALCGIALGRNRFLADVFSVYIEIASSLPRVVLGSIFVIALGPGMASKVALAVLMVFCVVFGSALHGVRDADRAMVSNARMLGASPRQLITSVVIPSALSWTFASLPVAFGLALVGAVVGEFLGSRQGLGLLVATAHRAFNANGVIAAMTVLIAMAFGARLLLSSIEHRLARWKPGPRDTVL